MGARLLGVTTTVLMVGGATTVVAFDAETGAQSWTGTGRYVGIATSLLFVLGRSKPFSGLDPDVGSVLDPDTGATLGTFSFAGGWVPPHGTFSVQGNGEVIVHTVTTATSSTITAVRLPTAGWIPPLVALAATPDGGGYWLAGQDGGVFAFGDAPFAGSLPGLGIAVDDIVDMAATPDGKGYWLAGQDGGVFAFGDARFYGSEVSPNLPSPVVGIGATPDGGGYWLVTGNGEVFGFGDAQFHGSILTTDPATLGQVIGISSTPDGNGYWLAAASSRMIPFGDASTFTNRPTNVASAPQVATIPAGGGYWSVGQDGGVFTAGNAQFYGSVPGLGLRINDATGITPTADGAGYWVLGADGGVFTFGDAQFYGSRG